MNDDSWIRVFAPATIANVGPGFDCFGLALSEPGDTVWARRRAATGIEIVEIRGDGGALPQTVSQNTAGRAAESVWRRLGQTADGLELIIEKGLPPCSGLGSSAASAVAGACVAARVAEKDKGQKLGADQLLAAAVDGEEVASGDRHADNVAPALLGGFVIVQSNHPLRVARLEPALPCHVAVVTPEIAISTRDSRAALPEKVPLAAAKANWANTASVVLALMRGDVDLLRRALNDQVIEPCRAGAIPGFAAAQRAAREAGTYGGSLSGSGPTLFSLAPDQKSAEAAAAAQSEIFARHGLSCQNIITTLSREGAREL